jgi:hypothetical protein
MPKLQAEKSYTFPELAGITGIGADDLRAMAEAEHFGHRDGRVDTTSFSKFYKEWAGEQYLLLSGCLRRHSPDNALALYRTAASSLAQMNSPYLRNYGTSEHPVYAVKAAYAEKFVEELRAFDGSGRDKTPKRKGVSSGNKASPIRECSKEAMRAIRRTYTLRNVAHSTFPPRDSEIAERYLVESLGIPPKFIGKHLSMLGPRHIRNGEIYYGGGNVRLLYIGWASFDKIKAQAKDRKIQNERSRTLAREQREAAEDIRRHLSREGEEVSLDFAYELHNTCRRRGARRSVSTGDE